MAAPSFCACSSLAWRIASCTAATTRSSSVSMSSGSTTLGSIVMRAQLAVTGDGRLHDPAAGGRFDQRVRERVLRGLHVGLHLLDLLEHVHRGSGSSSCPVLSRADVRRRLRRRGRRRGARPESLGGASGASTSSARSTASLFGLRLGRPAASDDAGRRPNASGAVEVVRAQHETAARSRAGSRTRP